MFAAGKFVKVTVHVFRHVQGGVRMHCIPAPNDVLTLVQFEELAAWQPP